MLWAAESWAEAGGMPLRLACMRAYVHSFIQTTRVGAGKSGCGPHSSFPSFLLLAPASKGLGTCVAGGAGDWLSASQSPLSGEASLADPSTPCAAPPQYLPHPPPAMALIAPCILPRFSGSVSRWERASAEHAPARSGGPIHICLSAQEYLGRLGRPADTAGHGLFLSPRPRLSSSPLLCPSAHSRSAAGSL